MVKRLVKDLLYEDLTYKIQGCFYKVYNTLGFGHKETVYQKALAKEFQRQGISFEAEKALSIFYLGEKVGVYRPDFVVEKKVIVEVKSMKFLPTEAEEQLIHYLKGTGFKLGFLVNFGAKRLEIKRRIWSKSA